MRDIIDLVKNKEGLNKLNNILNQIIANDSFRMMVESVVDANIAGSKLEPEYIYALQVYRGRLHQIEHSRNIREKFKEKP